MLKPLVYLMKELGYMVVQSLENLEKSGNKIDFREKLENLEKSGNFTERAQNNFLYVFILGGIDIWDKNFY